MTVTQRRVRARPCALACLALLYFCGCGDRAGEPLDDNLRAGIEFFLLGEYDTALESLASARHANPRDIIAVHYELLVKERTGTLDDWLRDESHVSAEGRCSDVIGCYSLAHAAFLTGNVETAWLEARGLISTEQRNPYVLLLVSQLHEAMNAISLARYYAERAHEVSPTDPEIARWLGLICRRLGDTDAAVNAMGAAGEAWPMALDLQLALYASLMEQGHIREAGHVVARTRSASHPSEGLTGLLITHARDTGQCDDWIGLLPESTKQPDDSHQVQRLDALFVAGRVSEAMSLLRRERERGNEFLDGSTERYFRGFLNQRPSLELVSRMTPLSSWPPDLEDGEPALVFLALRNSCWTEFFERAFLQNPEVVSAATGMPAFRLTQEADAKVFESLRGGGAWPLSVPALVIVDPSGSVIYRRSRASKATPKELAEVLGRIRQRQQWARDLNNAREKARAERKPVMAYLPGSGAWTKRMDASLSAASIHVALTRVVPVRLTDDSMTAEAVQVRPSLVFFDPLGHPIHRALGYRSASVVARDIERAVAALEDRERDTEVIDWLEDVSFAQYWAGIQNRRVFLFFYTDWCPPCKEMNREALSDPRVVSLLDSDYVTTRVNPDVDSTIHERFSIAGVPSVAIVSSDGRTVSLVSGKLSTEELLDELLAEDISNGLRTPAIEAERATMERWQLIRELRRRGLHRAAEAELELMGNELGDSRARHAP